MLVLIICFELLHNNYLQNVWTILKLTTLMKTFGYLFLFISLLSSSFAQAEKLKVLTYNTWGVPVAVWDTWRYQAAMKAIEELNPDIVILSEVFSAKGKHDFKSAQYPYYADGPNWFPRLLSSGTRILSKYPIEKHAILTYHACKSPDCFSRKGADFVLVTLPSGKKVNIVSTHLDSSNDEAVDDSQLHQLMIFSDYYEDKTSPTIFAGDMNFNPQSNQYQYARKNLNVDDSWEETHSASEPGITYDGFDNHYAHDYAVKTKTEIFKGRIDYLFHRGNVIAVSTELEFNDEAHLFSDHYGLLGEFEI